MVRPFAMKRYLAMVRPFAMKRYLAMVHQSALARSVLVIRLPLETGRLLAMLRLLNVR